MRSVGGRLPAPTRSTNTSSSAMFSNGGRPAPGSSFHGSARQRANSSTDNDEVSATIARFQRRLGLQRTDHGRRQRFRR
jgi:hypothetical protein